MTDGIQRSLAAILAADVVGYSRLMGEDEAGTLSALRHLRTNIFAVAVDAHRGRIVKSMGDGWLVEFASVVEAVTCAIEVQEGLVGHESIKLRVGVHLGDITHEEEDIFGDGVNIASRLPEIARPGGIVISHMARRSIDGKLAATFVDLGVQNLKNIAEPIKVYGWGMTAVTADATVLPLSDMPSIAVLAFDNLSGDLKQDYLSDGLSENIITALSRFPDFFVIARNSTFAYKGKPVRVQQVAEDLGVRYVVEGSIQIADDRLRATVQLIDATSGKHLWAERYDRELKDIFAIQDEITRTIAATLMENIDLAEYDRVLRAQTESLGAYEFRKRAQAQMLTFTKEGNIQARRLCEEALALDPNYSEAYVELTWVHINGYRWGWSDSLSREESLDLALEMARKAVEIDPFNYKVHWVLANATMQSGDLDKATAEYNRAIELNPNSAGVLADSVDTLVYVGRALEAVSRTKAAIRLNPYHPDWYLRNLGWAQYFAEQYEDALASFQKMNKMPNEVRYTLGPVLVRLGRLDEARAVIAEFLKNWPDYSIKNTKHAPFKYEKYLERWKEDLRKAGIPEKPP